MKMEKKVKVICPMCKGFGNTITNAKNDKHCICKGHGELWRLPDGRYLAIYGRVPFWY